MKPQINIPWYRILPRFLWYKLKEVWWLWIVAIIELFPIRLWLAPQLFAEMIKPTNTGVVLGTTIATILSYFIANIIAIMFGIGVTLIVLLFYSGCSGIIDWLSSNWKQAKRDELAKMRRIK